MDQALTNKKFIEQIDDVIETLGGTPVDLELTEDREDDMVSNGVFVDKMDEVIEALGGTPSEIIVGDDKADDMVSDNIFQLKMEDVVKNMSGGGGGSSDFSTAAVKIINATSSEVAISDCPQVMEDGSMSGGVSVAANTEATLSLIVYKGHAYITAITIGDTPMVNGTGITVTGDIVNESDEYEVYIIISGDGTITIS